MMPSLPPRYSAAPFSTKPLPLLEAPNGPFWGLPSTKVGAAGGLAWIAGILHHMHMPTTDPAVVYDAAHACESI